MICTCLPIVGVLLSETLRSPAKIFKSMKTCLPTGRSIIGRDAPAQADSQRTHYFHRARRTGTGKQSADSLFSSGATHRHRQTVSGFNIFIGRDAPAQANSQGTHYFPIGLNLDGRIQGSA
jgi:hypothetical protein